MLTEPAIGKATNYATLVVNKSKHQTYEKGVQQVGHFQFCSPTALIGIEIEVENVHEVKPLDYYWKVKEDGSLRNNGKEFTSIPLRATQIPYAIDYLNERLDQNKLDFSPRTSVHIHLNVRDMTWNQVKSLLLLYAIFERHFFHIAGAKRESSIFCVPLYKTQQLNCLTTLEYGPMWHKYNAVNAGTILGNDTVPRFGTLEFRHLYGTLDPTLLYPWIDNILKLRLASHKHDYPTLLERIRHMNTTSEYIALYQEVFGEYADMYMMQKHDFEHCISTTKMCVFGTNIPALPTSKFYKRYVPATEPTVVPTVTTILGKYKKIPAPHGFVIPTPMWATADEIKNVDF